jgi:Bacillus/Clostridium GerA spore germination protein
LSLISQESVELLSNGNTMLLYDGETQGLALGLAKWEKRQIEEPTAEGVVRGPREGFTESLAVNTSQLRRAGAVFVIQESLQRAYKSSQTFE